MTDKPAKQTEVGLPLKAVGGLGDVAQHPLFRGAMNILGLFDPICGTAAVALGAYAESALNRRVEVFSESVKEQLKQIEKEEKDEEYVRTEEFVDLVLKALEATLRTRHNDKIKGYAQIITRAIIKQDRIKHNPDSYLAVLAELSEQEMLVANELYGLQKEGPLTGEEIVSWEKRCSWKRLIGRMSISEEELRFSLRRLERTALITQLTGYLDTMDAEGHYVITEAYRKLIAYLEGQIS